MTTAIQEIVCPSPEAFEARPTSVSAAQLDALSRDLVEGDHPVPPDWIRAPGTLGSVARGAARLGADLGARVVVEATLSKMHTGLSQGSHFSHNMISFRVFCLSVRHTDSRCIDWYRLNKHDAVNETRFPLRSDSYLLIEVQGRAGQGAIRDG